MSSDTLKNDNNQFATKLFNKLANQKGNVFFSPYSIQIACAMLYAGARNHTANGIATACEFSQSGNALHHAFQQNLNSLHASSDESAKLTISNALWIQENFPVLSDFQNILVGQYGALVKNLDFKNDPEGARKTINDAISEQTNKLIPELFPSGSINSHMVSTLTNAIHFKGIWKNQFDEKRTLEDCFITRSGEKLYVPIMMRKEMTLDFFQSDNLQAVKLPYGDNGMHMLLVNGGRQGSICELEQHINTAAINKISADLTHHDEVDVMIPKFEISTDYKLAGTLSLLGMGSAFGANADYSGISAQPAMKITEVIHKAVVKVDEQGTEAAAATGFALECAKRTPMFDGRKPFLFFIRDANNTILFMGRMDNPLEK